MIQIEKIKSLMKDDKIKWSGHILTRMQQRGIKTIDIINCISNGEIIEYYPDDYPFPSCLILGYSDAGVGIHVVCALGQDYVWMITAYYPGKNEWLKDLKTRRR
jgi:hypothetical protein